MIYCKVKCKYKVIRSKLKRNKKTSLWSSKLPTELITNFMF